MTDDELLANVLRRIIAERHTFDGAYAAMQVYATSVWLTLDGSVHLTSDEAEVIGRVFLEAAEE